MRQIVSIIKNYIFDLDGTIIDSAKDITSAVKKACHINNISHINENFIKYNIGKSFNEILKNCLNQSEFSKIENIQKTYRKIYDYIPQYSCFLYDGVYEFLQELKEKNKKIFILTNKPSIPTNRILKQIGIESYFEEIITIDTFSNMTNKEKILEMLINKDYFSPKDSVFIGDTVSDMIAARNNNILAIAALWGYEQDKNYLLSVSDFGLEHLVSYNLSEMIDKFNQLRNIRNNNLEN